MSTYSPAVIDPALQDIPPPKPAGMKRKARSAVPVQPTRMTRRQAAAAATALPMDPPSSSSSSHHLDEPSRGEEENLISYEWARETTKRSRHRSPSAHQPRSCASPAPQNHEPSQASRPHTPRTPQQSHTPAWAGSAVPSAHPSPGGPAAGIESLAAAAAAYQTSPLLPPPPLYPYPYGLTPFRYECLTPHLPNPPPGDPADPAFRRFDPTHGSHFSPVEHPPAPDSHHAHTARSEQSVTEGLPERTEHHTLAALLSATEAAEGLPSSRPRTPDSRR